MTARRNRAADRHRSQRGSVLSSVLIIVAFMSILIGALMTELTDSFLASRTVNTRVERQATVTSAVELAIHQLQTGSVPAVCAQDARGPWFLTLNGSPSAVSETCTAIVPDLAASLSTAAVTIDGVHNTTAGRDEYIAATSSGRLNAYSFGQTSARWSVALGGQMTATLLPMVDDDGVPELMMPSSLAGSGCGGHCVAAMHYSGGTPSFHCSMPASSAVMAPPAVEVSPNGIRNFPDYVFFAGAGGGATLYVFDGAADHSCGQQASAPLNGDVIGAPLVFPGVVSVKSNSSSVSDEIFILQGNGAASSLEHWRYTEAVDKDGVLTISLSEVANLSLTAQLGGSPAGYAISAASLGQGGSITMAAAGASGGIALVRISEGNGPAYAMSLVGATALSGGVTAPPFWCHCPGQDLIGVGSTNGTLFLLGTSLTIMRSYNGAADGSPAIVSRPAADVNGDWYFGAADGYVYDVEIPLSGLQMFKAARFGPGGQIRSSPVVGGASDGCGPGPCLYFGSNTAGLYFAALGTTRVIDLRACISTAASSATCYANPRLWVRVEVGPASVVGGQGVSVQGWSYYSP
jgi:hypothetical protein